jgi:hypothetical protein
MKETKVFRHLHQDKPKRRRYFTQEDRAAAKRRRDAEYRERQRLKKLSEFDAGVKPDPDAGFDCPESQYEAGYGNVNSESDQSWNRRQVTI